MQRAVLTILEDNVQALGGLDEAIVLDDVGVVEVLEQVDLNLQGPVDAFG